MKKKQIGLYGLGVMGSSLAKNLIYKGVSVSLYSKSEKEREAFEVELNYVDWNMCSNIEKLVESLEKPRTVFLMVTAGEVVDVVINELSQYLEKGDIIIDGGNSHFKDTARRVKNLEEMGLEYLGIGVSGGEKGALTGPSMMVGGSKTAWNYCAPILEKMAAFYQNESCCKYLGLEGAGHYVKMVHNGIEYAILQLIADTYTIMTDVMKLPHEKIIETFQLWQMGRLQSYLIGITVDVLRKKDEDGMPLLTKILDVAKQKGTGNWTAEEALAMGVYAPTIQEAVFARHISGNTTLRKEGEKVLTCTPQNTSVISVEELESSLYAGVICSYAQGIELIQTASVRYAWDIDIVAAVKLWRAGCIIRGAVLEEIKVALLEEKQNIMVSNEISNIISVIEPSWRKVVGSGVLEGVFTPGLNSTLQYYDACRSGRMSVHLIQALRDCFGAHTYERSDKVGVFHTNWEKENEDE